MSRSFSRVEHGLVPGTTPSARFESGPHSFGVEVRDGQQWHSVQRPREWSEPLYEFAEPVHFAIGSGQRGRSFATRRGSRLFQSPVTWYTGGGWDLSPGYEHESRVPPFERKIGTGCLQCHVGKVEELPGRADEFTERVCVEASIGCERCHGPGRAHVDYHEGKSGAKDSTDGSRTRVLGDPIVHLARLEAGARDAVCYQCHLTGAERVVRFGRRETDFRPGDFFEEIWVAFIHDARGAGESADAVSQVEQMEASVCFQKSSGRLGCTSCHDPHSVPDPASRVAFFRDRCLTCHQEGDGCSESLEVRKARSSADSCVECHMPTGAVSDVAHTSQTDHRILRRPASGGAGQPDPRFHLFRNVSSRLPQEEIDRAQGLLMAEYGRRYNDRILAARAVHILDDLRPVFPDDPQLALQLGLTEELLRTSPDAETDLETAVRLAPGDAEIRRQFAIWLHKQGRYQEAAERMRELFVDVPDDTDIGGRLVHSLGMLGRTAEGIELAERLLKRFPYDWQVTAWLARAYLRDGERGAGDETRVRERARTLQKRAELLKPASVESP